MKRSERLSRSQRETSRATQNTPHYNTYYQPVGTPPRKRKSKGLFLKLLIGLIIVIALFFGVMYALSSRANVEDLKTIENKSTFVPINDMPEYTKGAFIAMEDERFYDHGAFDVKGIFRALFTTLSDQSVQGGSTISQQVVKNYYYGNEQSFTRKVKEILVASRMEREYSKEEILSFYVNNIYFGDNQYTIESAANHYFGTTTVAHSQNMPTISVLQSAILASKINAPSVYDVNNMSQNYINRVKINLEKMKQQGYINDQQYKTALAQLGV
ncbi:monofunctional peptidoglycan glycosyltransferase SgtB [Staphylococcus simulans]|uniref:monofunctional peptidoglycan glycosyltransferase SgtB n=1 Tax=Staphylococcus simulans TaxID=1286 RepID=UPI00399AB803